MCSIASVEKTTSKVSDAKAERVQRADDRVQPTARSRLGREPRADVERDDAAPLADERARQAADAAAGVEHQLAREIDRPETRRRALGAPAQIVVVHQLVEASRQPIVRELLLARAIRRCQRCARPP